MHFSPSGVAADVPAYFSCDARKSFAGVYSIAQGIGIGKRAEKS